MDAPTRSALRVARVYPRSFPLLTRDGRKLLTAALHYGRGAFAIFRANGSIALESIALLENGDFKMFGMIGRQLRALHYANRGEIELASTRPQRTGAATRAAPLLLAGFRTSSTSLQ